MSYPSSSSKSSSSSPSTPISNIYSVNVANLLITMPHTSGALSLLEEARNFKKARRLLVAEHVNGLVTTEPVSSCQMIHEMTGLVVLKYEIMRKAGGSDGIFLYDGLTTGIAGEDLGYGVELICIDTKVNGNDTKYVRRSCHPNALLKHVLAPDGKLGLIVVAADDLQKHTEVCLPFDSDWRYSDGPLECSRHKDDMELCGFEKERRKSVEERNGWEPCDLNDNEGCRGNGYTSC